MAVSRDDYGGGRLTFSPGAYLEIDRGVAKPTSATAVPTIQFYLTNYKVRDDASFKGCIEIEIDTNRLEQEHLQNTPADITFDKITNGL
jgi:hypothetical protein